MAGTCLSLQRFVTHEVGILKLVVLENDFVVICFVRFKYFFLDV